MHCLLESPEGRVERTASVKRYHRLEKQRIKELRCTIGLDFGSLNGRGLPEERMFLGGAEKGQRTEPEGALLEKKDRKQRPLM